MVDSRQASYNALDLRREEKSFIIALDYCSLALVYLCVAWVVVKHVNVGVSTLPRRRNCCLSNGTPTRYVNQQMRPLFQTPCQRGITTNYNIIVLTSGPYAVTPERIASIDSLSALAISRMARTCYSYAHISPRKR